MRTFLESSHQAGYNHMKKPYRVFLPLIRGFASEWLIYLFVVNIGHLTHGAVRAAAGRAAHPTASRLTQCCARHCYVK